MLLHTFYNMFVINILQFHTAFTTQHRYDTPIVKLRSIQKEVTRAYQMTSPKGNLLQSILRNQATKCTIISIRQNSVHILRASSQRIRNQSIPAFT